jgi:hypothetical protein
MDRVMREIKFRGKTKFDKKWVYGVPIRLGTDTLIVDNPTYFLSAPYKVRDDLASVNAYIVDADTVGQYTGYNDPDIYEGDILLCAMETDCVVRFKNGSFITEYRDGSECLLSDTIEICLGVIGNIIDNKW